LFFLFPSAGVGRTGVFLAIDTILDKLEKGVLNSIDVFGQVCAMRERRMHMVQTLVLLFTSSLVSPPSRFVPKLASELSQDYKL
jgi:protein tyrosine phosphatase